MTRLGPARTRCRKAVRRPRPAARRFAPAAVGAALLVTLAYPASDGLARYLVAWNVVGYETYVCTYRPLFRVLGGTPDDPRGAELAAWGVDR